MLAWERLAAVGAVWGWIPRCGLIAGPISAWAGMSHDESLGVTACDGDSAVARAMAPPSPELDAAGAATGGDTMVEHQEHQDMSSRMPSSPARMLIKLDGLTLDGWESPGSPDRVGSISIGRTVLPRRVTDALYDAGDGDDSSMNTKIDIVEFDINEPRQRFIEDCLDRAAATQSTKSGAAEDARWQLTQKNNLIVNMNLPKTHRRTFQGFKAKNVVPEVALPEWSQTYDKVVGRMGSDGEFKSNVIADKHPNTSGKRAAS